MQVRKSEYIELSLATGNTKKYFGDISVLRNKTIIGVDVFAVANVTDAPSGSTVVSDTTREKGFLVLNVDGSEVVNRLPLAVLNPLSNYERLTFNHIVDWPKSYIEFGDAVGSGDNGNVVFLVVHYL